MGKRAAGDISHPGGKKLTPEDIRHMSASRVTKSGVHHVLRYLHEHGFLDDHVGTDRISRAVAHHASVQTPFGSVVRPFDLGIAAGTECCDPASLLYYMCSISVTFADICKQTVMNAGDMPLRYLVYQDGVVPGNPFRPEKGRKVEAWYWVVVDWPSYLIHRSGMWPIFSLIRTRIVETIPGGVSHVTKRMVHMFNQFIDGVMLPHPDGPFVMRLRFAGFIADLAAHKEILCSKGIPNGVRPCPNCANLTSRSVLQPGEHGYLCHDLSMFLQYDDTTLFDMIDRLHAIGPTCNASALDRLTTEIGYNYQPHGLLMDVGFRGMYSPTRHHHKDWMHTIVSDGVGNWETGMLLQRMKSCPANIMVSMVQRFMMACILPHQRGKPNKEWLNDKRLREHNFASFASTMLTIIPIVTMFLDHFPVVAHHLPDHVKCYRMLNEIVWILRCDEHGKRTDVLRRIIGEHHELWARLYPESSKPKLHHLLHVPQGIDYLGKAIACFTCERKHREVKRTAVNVYRHFEHTTIIDMLHAVCDELSEHDLFAEQTLVRCDRKVVVGALQLMTSDSCLCHCGELNKDDIVVFEHGVVGKVSSFWKHPDSPSITVQFVSMKAISDTTAVYIEDGIMFAPVSKIIDAVVWFPMDTERIRVSMPPASVLS